MLSTASVTSSSLSLGGGTGLKADYYDNSDFTNLKLTRTDATVNFNWGSGAPASTIGADTFSVRWTGQVQALHSETYTFYTTGDDGIRLWVNGQQLINGWKNQSATEYRGTIALQAGQKYNIRLEYYENGGSAVARLAWSSASLAKQIIPQAQLFNTVPVTDTIVPTATAAVTNITTATANGYTFTVTYSDNAGIDVSSLDSSDIRVTGPNGYSQLATRDAVNSTTNGTPRTVTYRITPPGGSWDSIDNGTYTIALQANQVRDINGNWAAAGTLGTFSVNIPTVTPGRFNYGEALQKSIYFYDAQRSGRLPSNNRVEWRGDSALLDGSDVGRDLTGGFYDAGDRIKFSRTIAYSAAMLSWGWLETPTAYQTTGQSSFLLSDIQWATDYLLKAFTNDTPGQYEFYTQVGSMGSGRRDDHQNWVPAEVIHEVTDRPSYKINIQTPDSAIAGQAAAALASASIVFRQNGNATYANTLLSKAERLFDFANTYRGMNAQIAPNGSRDTSSPYQDVSFYDELLWGATWLHKAKLAQNNAYGNSYLTQAEQIYNDGAAGSIRGNYTSEQSWQWVDKGAKVLLAELTNKTVYRTEVQNYLDYWTVGYNGQRIAYTPGGLAWRDAWGSLRYATTQAFVALAYSDLVSDTAVKSRYENFAVRQVNYALGDNPYGRSYMLGFGANPMTSVHHSTANGPWAGWNQFTSSTKPRHILYGALLGGPNQQDGFTEDMTNYQTNEVAIDYNAGLTGALARLYSLYGGNPLASFPAPETRSDQFFVEASVNATGSNFVEIKAWVNNQSSWPAKVTDKLSFRYYFTLDNGVNPANLTVTIPYAEAAVTSQIRQYRDNIYYADVNLTGTKIFPGGYDAAGKPTFRKEVRFRINSPLAWSSSNDWSFQGVAGTGGQPIKVRNITVYDNGVKVFGVDPV
ncbi:glycoside hydrolase family 9 protein [Alkalinema sp. FACHB-956]|uniref:glycoside hydrolase family 9 protein n=1 Tax=Alkalinema sp. FACHB-956 TaxID=2692768 RepID=UPI00168A322E|nr:glycoside hydrolase family 9 protein [Alkalinema sp. FACHB-956]MBD2327710.1 glycoside hydrolase family 9 protein [Alkalinema sp. FACHB-956]